jgi:carbohydrate-selective porin OprB
MKQHFMSNTFFHLTVLEINEGIAYFPLIRHGRTENGTSKYSSLQRERLYRLVTQQQYGDTQTHRHTHTKMIV